MAQLVTFPTHNNNTLDVFVTIVLPYICEPLSGVGDHKAVHVRATLLHELGIQILYKGRYTYGTKQILS